MSDQAVEILITNAIHTAFIKYPEGDGGPRRPTATLAPVGSPQSRPCLQWLVPSSPGRQANAPR
jgi:hypothetical protein